MPIRTFSLLALIWFLATAQDTGPEGFQLWSAKSLKQLEQELTTGASGDPKHLATKRLVDYPNELFMLARRQADGVVEWHENQVDVFLVQSGTATLVVGGKMVGEVTTEPMKNEADKSRAGFAALYPPAP